MNVPFENWLNNFYFERNFELENKLYVKTTKEIGNKYILIHEDLSRSRKKSVFRPLEINRKNIINPSNYPIINLNGISNIFFDTCMLLENAYEIHVMDSCYALLLLHMYNMKTFDIKCNIYIHKYVRPDRDYRIFDFTNFVII